MPKQQLSLNKFEGGMSDVYDPRDLGANSLSDITDAIVSTIGKIKVTSRVKLMDQFPLGDTICSSARGYGLFALKSNYIIGEEGDISTYDDNGNSRLKITTVSDHHIYPGDKVKITGISRLVDGYQTVIDRVSATVFVTNYVQLSMSAAAPNNTAKYIKLNSYEFYNSPNIVMGNGRQVSVVQGSSFLKNVIEIYSKTKRGLDGELSSISSSDDDEVKQSFYWSNGGLRVSDGNFKNVNNRVNKVYEYLPAKTYFNFGSQWYPGTHSWHPGELGGGGDAFYQVNSSGGCAVATNTAGGGIGSSYMIVRPNGVNEGFDNASTYNVSFDLEMRAEIAGVEYNITGDGADPEAVASWPVVYFSIDHLEGPDDENKLTQVELAIPGHNNFTFTPLSNLPAGNISTGMPLFATNKVTAYTISNYSCNKQAGILSDSTRMDNLSGRKAGWYDSPQEIVAPTFHPHTNTSNLAYIEGVHLPTDSYDNFTALTTGISNNSPASIGPDCLVMALKLNTDINNSDWLFGGGAEGANNDHTFLSFAHSWVYEDDQESLLFSYEAMNPLDTINAIPAVIRESDPNHEFFNHWFAHVRNRGLNFEDGFDADGLDFKLKFKLGTTRHERRIGSRLYLTGFGPAQMQSFNGVEDINHPPLIDDPLLFADINFETGVTLFDGTFSPWTSEEITDTPDVYSMVEFKGISKFPSLTYRLLNLYSHKQSSLYARYKTSAIANNRVYIGGVQQEVDKSGEMRSYPDRIIKSPVGKHDIFPSDNTMDVVRNDGESIVALYAYNGRLLQFKQNTLYIINIAAEMEFVESQSKGMGISHPAHAIETDFGIAFFNSTGCYIYDGEKVASLTAQKLDASKWKNDFPQDGGCIGYSPIDKYLLCAYGNTQLLYSFITQSWVKTSAVPSLTSLLTNMITLSPQNGIVIGDKGNSVMDNATGSIDFSHNDGTSATTEEVIGVKATGSITWDQLNMPGDDYVRNKMTSGATTHATQVTGTFEIDIPAYQENFQDVLRSLEGAFALQFNEYVNAAASAADNVYDPAILRYGITAVPYPTSWIIAEEKSGVQLIADSFGEDMNAPAGVTGNSAIYGQNNATLGTGGSDNVEFIELSGGVDPVPGKTTVTIVRADTAPGDKFSIKMRVGGVDGEPITYSTAQYLHYTTVDGNSATTVATELTSLINNHNILSNGVDASSSGAVITIEARAKDPETDFISIADGYYTFQNEDFEVFSEERPDLDFREFTPSLLGINSIGTPVYNVVTKDIDFGSPGVRKKVYKIYVTYKCGSESYITADFFINNASAVASNRKSFTAGASYNYTNSTLNSSSNEWKVVELIPSTSSDSNNIYSIALGLRNNGSGVTPSDFEINDITFIYRVKNIK